MSEELLQTTPIQIGPFTYYPLGSTTLNQLRTQGLVPSRDYGELGVKRPDGLLLRQGTVSAVVEYKPPEELRTDSQIQEAITQEIEVAKALCSLLIVTDGQSSYWINAHTRDPIIDPEGVPVNTVFHPFDQSDVARVVSRLEEVLGSVTGTNSRIVGSTVLDPTPIAARLWQTIWVATGKSPIKCLYNVVELFVFKFLSDLNLLPADVSFSYIQSKSLDSPEDALDFYARNSRVQILRLFPAGEDGTTIINGTIFVNEAGEANLSQAILFARCLSHLQDYAEEVGSLTKIDKQFKTSLYEAFLNQEVEALGQYFTPRKVVQSVVRMAGMHEGNYAFSGKRICDPFCGVGGFLLEVLNLNERMMEAFTPDVDGRVDVPFVLHGFDKGFERDDERTIILAKANMLIYLAEILFVNPSCTDEFARVFNETFHLFRDNLGTFGHLIDDVEERYDVVLSNPPYVTSGSSIIKEEIQSNPATAGRYPVSGLGLESLSVEWIVESLKPGGKAFVIVPDGLLARANGNVLREYMMKECYVDAIVSLPRRTFFANHKNTYILALTKKHHIEDLQSKGVFAYVVSNIGERLTSVRREAIEENDLPEMEALFRAYQAAPFATERLIDEADRCRVIAFAEFQENPHWVVNRWWSEAERRQLEGEEIQGWDGGDVSTLMAELAEAVVEFDVARATLGELRFDARDVVLGDATLFETFIGRRHISTEVNDESRPIPIYSANVNVPFGFVDETNVDGFDRASVLWGIDGNFQFRLMDAGEEFATTDHCGVLRVVGDEVLPAYLFAALSRMKGEVGFDRTFRASLTNMRRLAVPVPINSGGEFDVEMQEEVAEAFQKMLWCGERMRELKDELDQQFGRLGRE